VIKKASVMRRLINYALVGAGDCSAIVLGEGQAVDEQGIFWIANSTTTPRRTPKIRSFLVVFISSSFILTHYPLAINGC
jgi:hypothetical protein